MKATFTKQTVNKLTPFDIADKNIFFSEENLEIHI